MIAWYAIIPQIKIKSKKNRILFIIQIFEKSPNDGAFSIISGFPLFLLVLEHDLYH